MTQRRRQGYGPPRAKDRVEGATQVGLFIRTDDGVLYLSWNDAPPYVRDAVKKVVAAKFTGGEVDGKEADH